MTQSTWFHKNLRRGSTRFVVLIWEYAFKVPSTFSWKTFLLGMLANIQESEWSHASFPNLCPVLFKLPLGVMVVMKRAAPLTEHEWETFERDELYNFINRDGYVVPVEAKMDSFGWCEGEITAIDYG